MRTSLVSRDTARVVRVRSQNPAAATTRRRSSRLSESVINDKVHELATHDVGNGTSHHLPSTSSSLGKRKRVEVLSTNSIKLETADLKLEEATALRTSPRKQRHETESIGDTRKLGRKAIRQPAKRITGSDGRLQFEPPPTWAKMYEVTAQMRKRVLAPVDTMGCESLAEQHRSPQDQRLQTLVSLMLSSQTKDTVTAAAMRNLQQKMPGGFCLQSLLDIPESGLNGLIEKVGFHNTKAKHIKKTAIILRDQFHSDIPDTITDLMSLPGVGPKMAYLCMSAAWGRDEGIGVDVHVHRITNLWGWHKTNSPEQTRETLQCWLPKEKWHDINHLLVGFGQTICLPVGRKCGECDLASQNLCPSAVVPTSKQRIGKNKVKSELLVDDDDDDDDTAAAVKIEVEADQ